MVENAREELAKRDRSLESAAASVLRAETRYHNNTVGQTDAMKMVETLERDLSERERRER